MNFWNMLTDTLQKKYERHHNLWIVKSDKNIVYYLRINKDGRLVNVARHDF